MAKKKNDALRTDLIVGIEWDKDGTLKTFRGDAGPEEEAFASRLLPQLLKVAQSGPSLSETVPTPGAKLFAQIDLYLDEQTNGGGWSEQTAMDARGDFQQFKAVLGDIPTAALHHEALNALKDTLLKLPANVNKLKETRGRSIPQILALGLPAQSPRTVQKKWDRVSAFCVWLEGKGLIDKNYAKGKKPKAKAQSYEKFTKDDLGRIFESHEYRTGTLKEAFQYWLPILGLFSGARLEELSQLHIADVRLDADTNIWALEITEEIDEESGAETGKKLKNLSSQRKCPIHSDVIAAGLLTYIDDLKAKGYDRLFPELVPDTLGKVSGRASEWFTEYRRANGVGELTGKSRKNFHSFRHTMISSLQKAGVPQEMREALCGHASQSVSVNVYGTTDILVLLKEAIEKLDFPITLAPFIPSDGHERARLKAIARQ
jgi:integrase